jgi:hypothetical protein
LKIRFHYIAVTATKSSDNFLSFLEKLHQDLSQRVITFNKDFFEDKMLELLGDVTEKQCPTRLVTTDHLNLLQAITICVDASSQRAISAWVYVLRKHLNNPLSTNMSGTCSTLPSFLDFIYYIYA